MREQIIKNIKNYNLIEENDIIIVGYSGGKDSSFLLHQLVELRDEYKLRIIAAHLNHCVRGGEADRDEEFCRENCAKLGVEFFSKRASMNKFAKDEGISKEAAGRILRRKFFLELLEKTSANKIALAHNYNDQVETLLMRIFRGTGIDGLQGIDYKNGNIIRPILNIKRSEIDEYIITNNISYVEDSTNFESNYYRNKFRNMIIPNIEVVLGEKIEDSIFKLSELAKLDVDFINNYVDNLFGELAIIENNQIKIDTEKFKKLDKAIKYRLIRRVFVELLNYLDDISLKNVQAIDDLFYQSSGKFIDNINGIRIRNSYGKLVFEKNENTGSESLYIELNKGINEINEGLKISLEFSNKKIDNENTISIPIELIENKLVVRNRQMGDRIRPIGLNGSKKLKDIFIDKKIDRLERDNYIVISDGANIFWLLGLVKSELTNLKSKTNEYAIISIEK